MTSAVRPGAVQGAEAGGPGPARERRRATVLLLAGLAGWSAAARAVATAPGVPAPASASSPAAVTVEPEARVTAEPLQAAALWDLDNQPVRWGALAAVAAAQPLIVNFWARWCAPCRVEIPELVALTDRKAGVKVLGLALEHDPVAVRDFARAYEINYPVLLTRGAGLDLMRALGNRNAGLPFTIALDRRGAVVASRLGVLTRAHLDAAVRKALA